MHNGCSVVRCVDDVDFSITALNGIGIGEGIVSAGNIYTTNSRTTIMHAVFDEHAIIGSPPEL